MFDDFCSECQFRQNPAALPMSQGGCGAQFPMQGPMMMPPMQGTMIPGMQVPMIPGMQAPGNIYQTPTAPPVAGMPTQPSGLFPQASAGGTTQPSGPSPVPGVTFTETSGSPVFQDTRYLQGYLRTLIGRSVRVEFLIGTQQLRDRQGTLLEVGISYIVLREAETDDNVMCDLFSIKFVTVFL